MDVGIFKASNTRLVAWIVVPPLLITAVGLSSYALQRRAKWQLEETRALSDVLPDVMMARKNVQALFNELGLSGGKRITSADELTALLDEKAKSRNLVLKRRQVLEPDKRIKAKIPTISIMVEATGDFSSFQLFLNDVKTACPLIAARSISMSQSRESDEDDGFELKVVFDLLQVGNVMKATGGLK